MPQRIQRQRRKGWRKGSAVIVTRPSRWGNPYVVPLKSPPEVIIAAVERFSVDAEARLTREPDWLTRCAGRIWPAGARRMRQPAMLMCYCD
jgi:hypothetical protein